MGNLQNESEGNPGLPRRGFLNSFLISVSVAFAGAVIYPVLRFINPPKVEEAVTNQVLAGTVSQLAEEKWKIFPFGSEPAILIEVEPGDYRAFSAMCTHLSCTVQYEDESQRIWCACHNGWYDLNGRVVAGPPPHPLDRYEVNVVGDDIFVLRS